MDMIGRRNLRDLLKERADRHPDRCAMIVEHPDGDVHELTYRELLSVTRTVAAGFERMGVRPGDTVVMQAGNSREFVAAWAGLAWLGAVAVPSNTANTLAEMRHVLSLSESRYYVADAAAVSAARAGLSDLDLTWITTRDDTSAHDVARWIDSGPAVPQQEVELGPDTLAELIFTSGTTSLPKAVMLTHGNYLYAGERESRTMLLDESDRLLTALPLFHVNAQSNTLLSALTVGATAIILPGYRASTFWRQVRDLQATQISLVAMQLRTMLAQPVEVDEKDHRVRRAIYAINVTTAQKEDFERRFGLELMNGYGLSEAMTVVTAAPALGSKRWPSIGLPAAGRDVLIVDSEGEEAPLGEVGEIVVGGVPGRSLMAGYYRDAEATAAALTDGWLRTGDLGRMDEKGYFYFVDRAKDIIKRAGENVSSGEVESVLTQHPFVEEAAVVGIPDPIRDEAVKAFIVPVAGTSLDVDDLLDHARTFLAAFKVPTEVEVVESLPRTSVGKVRKRDLRRPATDRTGADG